MRWNDMSEVWEKEDLSWILCLMFDFFRFNTDRWSYCHWKHILLLARFVFSPVLLKDPETLGWWSWCWFQAWWIQAFGQERVLRTDSNLHPRILWGLNSSHPFPTLDSVEIHRFSASKVVITTPFLIRPLISWVGGYLQIWHENFSPSHHKVLSRRQAHILLARWTFSPEKVFNGCDYKGFMDVASSSFFSSSFSGCCSY